MNSSQDAQVSGFLSVNVQPKLNPPTTEDTFFYFSYFYRNKTIFQRFVGKSDVEAVFMSVLDYSDVIYRQASSSTLKVQMKRLAECYLICI